MTPIDPAFYRSELCLAANGDWHLLRDGQQIAVLAADPDGITVTGVIAARAWGRLELAKRGVTVSEWLNGMGRPSYDSGYWVTEPVDPGAPSSPDLMALYDTLNSLALAALAAAGSDPDCAQPFLMETALAEAGAFPPGSDEAEALRVLIGAVERQAAVTS